MCQKQRCQPFSGSREQATYAVVRFVVRPYLRHWAHFQQGHQGLWASTPKPSDTPQMYVSYVSLCFLKHTQTACSTSCTRRFKIDCMSEAQKTVWSCLCGFLLLFYFSPACITTVNVTSWHLDSARLFAAFLLLNQYICGVWALWTFLREERVMSSLKSYFRSHFYGKPVILIRPADFSSSCINPS